MENKKLTKYMNSQIENEPLFNSKQNLIKLITKSKEQKEYKTTQSYEQNPKELINLRTQTEREILDKLGEDKDAVELAKSIVEEIDKYAHEELGLYGKVILVAAIYLEIKSSNLVSHAHQTINESNGKPDEQASEEYIAEEICNYDEFQEQDACEIVLQPKVIARREVILQDVLNLLSKFKHHNILANEQATSENELRDMFKVDTKANILKNIGDFYVWLKSLKSQEVSAQQVFKNMGRAQCLDNFIYCLYLCQDQKIELQGKNLILEKIRII